MQIQKVFQAGNSQVVAIPKNLAQELDLRVGHKVVMGKTADGTGLVIKRAEEKKSRVSPKAAKREFDQWVDMMVEEDKELIQELATR